MSAQVIAFPEFASARAHEASQVPPSEVSSLECQFKAAFAEAVSRQSEKDTQRLQRRQDGNRPTRDYYEAGTIYGTGKYAEGERREWPMVCALSMESVRKSDVLRFNQQEEALQLAINQLNVLSGLVRYGGLVTSRAHALPGYVEDKLQDYESNCLADLAEAMVKLRAFGAIA